MVKFLAEMKKILAGHIGLSYPMVHVIKPLKEFAIDNVDYSCLDKLKAHFLILKGRELSDTHKEFISKSWDANALKAIKENTVCIFVIKDASPIACTMINLNGKGMNSYPFEYHFYFGEKSSYGFALYVSDEFRNCGLAKALHLKQFQIAKENGIEFCNRFIVKDNVIPLRIANKFGYKRMEERVQIKFFRLKKMLILDTKVKQVAFQIARKSAKRAVVSFANIFVALRNGSARAAGQLLSLVLIGKKAFSVFFPKVYLLLGKAKGSGEALSVLFIGRSEINPYYANKLFELIEQKKILKTTFIMNMSRELRNFKGRYDIAIINGYFLPLCRWLFRKEKDLHFIPNYAAQINFSFKGMDDFQGSRDTNAKRIRRMVKRHNYTYEFSRDYEKLLFFYKNMYLPYIANRYAGEEVIMSFKKIKKIFKEGGLLLLKDEDRYVAGTVVSLKNNIFHPNYAGIINGDVSLLKERVIAFLYYLYFEISAKEGYTTVDLGLSRPFLDDGVLQHKKRWNTNLVYDSKRANFLILKINKLNGAVKHFLINNPFVALEKKYLTGNVYVNSVDSLNFDETYKKYHFNGMKHLKVSFLNTQGRQEIRFTKPNTFRYSSMREYLNKKRVLVLDAESRQAIYIAQSLGLRGIEISCVSSNPYASSFYSKYCSEKIYFKDTDNRANYEDFLRNVVKKRKYELLIPCSDYSTETVSQIREYILPYSRVFLPSKEIIKKVTSKADLTRLAMKYNIPVPKTFFPENLGDVEKLDGQLKYPLVVKGDKTTGAQKVRYAHSIGELIAKFKEIAQIDSRPIIQQFINGAHKTFYGLCDKGEVIASFMFEGGRCYPPTGGVPARAFSIYDQRLKDISLRLLKEIQWEGILGINFKQDYGSEEFYLIDFNPRFGGTIPLAITSGVDFPYLLYKLVVEGKKEYVSNYTKIKYRNIFKEDVLYGLRRPFSVPKLLLEFLESNVYYGFDKTDPLPFIYLAKNTKWAIEEAIKKRILLLKRKR